LEELGCSQSGVGMMTMLAEMSHSEEVRRGERFGFGRNWRDFLTRLTVRQIRLAETSLKDSLGVQRLDGQTFLDIGSGSGLFSLAARRLGASVTSFDYDPDSVRCTTSLRDRYYPRDPNWQVEQGSVLDPIFLERLGTYDCVYSWGVLHHTGEMWRALQLIMPTVKVGGKLFIALYNDQGEATDRWATIKRRYNALPRLFAMTYALGIIARHEARELRRQVRQGTPGDWLRTWTEYDQLSTRGMSRWHDWIDWIGGYPYERVRIEPVVDFFSRDGFELSHLVDRSTGYGCNEFVFNRIAPAGVQVDSRIPRSASMARRFGMRLWPPFDRNERGWSAKLQDMLPTPMGTTLFLVRDDVIVGRAEVGPDGRVRVGDPEDSAEDLKQAAMHLLAAEDRPLGRPYVHVRGKLFEAGAPDLATLSDTQEDPSRSSVFVFEDDRQLPMPHAVHDEIAAYGAGRFSHWGASIYFSSIEGVDPNSAERRYRLLLPPQPIAAERSLARQLGVLVEGPFELGEAGWTAAIARPSLGEGESIFVMRDSAIVSEANWDEKGRLIIAPAHQAPSSTSGEEFRLVAAVHRGLTGPFVHERGNMWQWPLPEFAHLADMLGNDTRSKLFLFEDGQQLPYPHAVHDEIDQLGKGRFSHWEGAVLFSSSDGSDPNTNGRAYHMLVARQLGRAKA
jgi:2-polyprenyl-3-methyl-5-hydroxy-6-metoxy-1,4-benzoquinol methylase